MEREQVLFLQGPFGPFFGVMAETFSRAGCITHRICFNGGDRLYAKADHVVDYAGRPEHWGSFLHDYLRNHAITTVFVFGDCRFYHRVAREVCRERQVLFMVLEEGYLRPDTITMESGGVNALTELDLSPEALRREPKKELKPAVHIGDVFRARIRHAAAYYLYSRWRQKDYRHYRHHRCFSPWREGGCWIRGYYRKHRYKRHDADILARAMSVWSGRFFLLPLQVHDDSQMLYHSPFRSVRAVIEEVVASFASHASSDALLLLKHHPMDRGYSDYAVEIKAVAARYLVSERVQYCYDAHLPDLLRNTCGVVTVNSTVGLSALYHRVPVKLLGRCLFDIPGLAHQGSLADFWQNPQPVDNDLFSRFHRYLFRHTQVNGSFFGQMAMTAENCFQAWQKRVAMPGVAVIPVATEAEILLAAEEAA